MPRVFGHAHLGATESITAFMYLLTVYLFVRGLKSWKYSLALGIIFGLALDTKINCVFLPFILILWAQIYRRREYHNNVAAMLLLAPLVMVAAWPWLWYDTIVRVLDYLRFHATHQFTAVYYFGAKYNYGGEPAPWHYPIVMTFLTLPPMGLAGAILGAAWVVTKLRKDAVAVLILLNAAFPIVLSSLPQSPKYDGVRLFFPAFPFIAMLAGLLVYAIAKGNNAPSAEKAGRRRTYGIIALVVIVACGVINTVRSHPHELSYYNYIIGEAGGAYEIGIETTYWGEAVNEEVLAYMNERLPKGASLKTLAIHTRIFDYLQQWGMLRKDLKINGPPPYDYHLLLVRKGFFGHAERFLYRWAAPEKVFSYNGVPLVMIYKTPEQMRVIREVEE
jgi:hypothetical protein